MKKWMVVFAAIGAAFFGACSNDSDSGNDTGAETEKPAVTISVPEISPAGGDYTEGFKEISIATATSGLDIYYTTDGTNPTTASSRYTTPFNIIGSKTVKAVAYSGTTASAVVSATYTLNAGKSASQLGVITGRIGLASNLDDEVQAKLADSTVYIYSDELPGVVKQGKMGERFYFDGLDTSKAYSFYFSNQAPGTVIGSRAASVQVDIFGIPIIGVKVNDVVPQEGAGTDLDTVELKPTGTITGHAYKYGEDGTEESDHAGITVFIPGTSFSAFTAKDGAFELSGVPQGLYTVRAMYAGYTYSEKENIVLKADSEDTPTVGIDTDFALYYAKGTLKGTVLLGDQTSSAGVDVVITDTTNNHSKSASTSASGGWTMNDVTPGTYSIEFHKDGYVDQTINDVIVTGAKITTVPRVVLQEDGGSITGSVSVSATTNRAGISVLAERMADGTSTAKTYYALTNVDGAFSFASVAPGIYTITATYAGYKSVSVPNIPIAVGDEVSVGELAISEKATYSVTGSVVLAGMESGFEGTAVLLQSTTDASYAKSTTTNEEGIYIISDVDVGSYVLTFSRSGFVTNSSVTVEVGATSIAVVESVALQTNAGTVTGTVTLESAETNAGISILVYKENDKTTSYTTVTDSTGHFAVAGVTPGLYRVQATKSGYTTGISDPFTVSSGITSSPADMQLSISLRSLYGSVTLSGRTDSTGVRITATNITKTTEIYSALSNREGFYALSGMTPGEYILSYSYEGYRSYTSTSVSLTAESSLSLDEVTLEKATGKISGIVNLEGCTDHSGILVTLVGTELTFTTESDGAYEFTVPSGNYPGGVRFSKEDYQLTAKAETIPVLTDSIYSVLTVEMKATANTVKGTVDLVGSDDDSGITVSVDGKEDVTATTDETGAWTLFHVPLGYQTIRFAKTNVPDVTTEVEVVPSDYIEVGKLEMIPDSATLKGYVYLTDMTDHQGVAVTITTSGKSDITVRTTSDGAFEATNILASGSHDITFSKNGWESQTITIDDFEPLEVRTIGTHKEYVLVDTTAPTLSEVTINRGANFSNSTKLSVDLAATDEGSGISKMGVQVIPTIDGVEKSIYPSEPAWQDYKVSFDYDLSDLPGTVYSGNGTYTLIVTLRDKAGNVSATAQKAITITNVVTSLTGVLKGDLLHLTKERSPYLVEADCNVSENDTLVIDAGVEIRFAGDYVLSVSGEIQACGTADERILFTSNSIDEQYPWFSVYWKAVQIKGGSLTTTGAYEYASGNILEYCDFEYAANGVAANATVLIKNCTFSNNGNSVDIRSDSVVMNNVFENGLYLQYCSPIVANNIIKNSLYIWRDSPTIRHNTITNASISSYMSGYCSDNIFESSSFSVSDVYASSVYTNNNFIDCSSPIVSTTSGYQSGKAFNFSGNFWGAGNIDELNLKGADANISFISDNYDNFNYARVDYSNWLTQANANAGYQGDSFVPSGQLSINCSLGDNTSYADSASAVAINYGVSSYTKIQKYAVLLDGVSVYSQVYGAADKSTSVSGTYTLGLPYMSAGSHTVTIAVTDVNGNTDSVSKHFTITHSDVSGANLAGTSWNTTTGQPLKDSRTALLWHLDASGAEVNNNDATIGGYRNAIGGFGGCASYVSTSDSIALDMNANAFTVEYWIKGSNGWNRPYLYVSKGSTFRVHNDFVLAYESSNSIDSSWYTTSQPAGDTEWHHVAKVYGGTYVATYIDGVLIDYTDGISIKLNNSTEKLYMDLNYADAVDEIRISTAARSADEIAAYYKDAAAVLGKTTGSLDAIVY